MAPVGRVGVVALHPEGLGAVEGFAGPGVGPRVGRGDVRREAVVVGDVGPDGEEDLLVRGGVGEEGEGAEVAHGFLEGAEAEADVAEDALALEVEGDGDLVVRGVFAMALVVVFAVVGSRRQEAVDDGDDGEGVRPCTFGGGEGVGEEVGEGRGVVEDERRAVRVAAIVAVVLASAQKLLKSKNS